MAEHHHKHEKQPELYPIDTLNKMHGYVIVYSDADLRNPGSQPFVLARREGQDACGPIVPMFASGAYQGACRWCHVPSGINEQRVSARRDAELTEQIEAARSAKQDYDNLFSETQEEGGRLRTALEKIAEGWPRAIVGGIAKRALGR